MQFLDFVDDITERSQIKTFIESDAGVRSQEAKLYSAFVGWWQEHSTGLIALPKTHRVMELRSQLLTSFVESLKPVGLLDRFKISGVVASWWDGVKYELRILSELGFGGLVDSWVDTIADALKPDDEGNSRGRATFDPLNHKLVVQLLADYLAEIAQAETAIAELEQQKEAFERGDEEETEASDEEEGETVNVVKEMEERRKRLKAAIKEKRDRVKFLQSKKAGSIAALRKESKDTTILELEVKELEIAIAPVELEIEEIDTKLEPYNEIKKNLATAKTTLRKLKAELVDRLKEKRKELTEIECETTVLVIFQEGLRSELDRYVMAHRQQVIAVVENWWDKYRVTLREIEQERDAAAARLNEFLRELGYAES